MNLQNLTIFMAHINYKKATNDMVLTL